MCNTFFGHHQWSQTRIQSKSLAMYVHFVPSMCVVFFFWEELSLASASRLPVHVLPVFSLQFHFGQTLGVVCKLTLHTPVSLRKNSTKLTKLIWKKKGLPSTCLSLVVSKPTGKPIAAIMASTEPSSYCGCAFFSLPFSSDDPFSGDGEREFRLSRLLSLSLHTPN